MRTPGDGGDRALDELSELVRRRPRARLFATRAEVDRRLHHLRTAFEVCYTTPVVTVESI